VSPYLAAIVIAAVALLAAGLMVLRAVVLARRFSALAMAHCHQFVVQSAAVAHRRAELAAELARRGGRVRHGSPRTMR